MKNHRSNLKNTPCRLPSRRWPDPHTDYRVGTVRGHVLTVRPLNLLRVSFASRTTCPYPVGFHVTHLERILSYSFVQRLPFRVVRPATTVNDCSSPVNSQSTISPGVFSELPRRPNSVIVNVARFAFARSFVHREHALRPV